MPMSCSSVCAGVPSRIGSSSAVGAACRQYGSIGYICVASVVHVDPSTQLTQWLLALWDGLLNWPANSAVSSAAAATAVARGRFQMVASRRGRRKADGGVEMRTGQDGK